MRAFIKKAGDGIRTRDSKLGKLALYQLSYARNQYICITQHPKNEEDFLSIIFSCRKEFCKHRHSPQRTETHRRKNQLTGYGLIMTYDLQTREPVNEHAPCRSHLREITSVAECDAQACWAIVVIREISISSS